VVREALTRESLDALEPRDAAALFIARRAEGLTAGEQLLLEAWLARDESHRRAYESAERAWQVFAGSENDEVLAAMRAHAMTSRRRRWPRWHAIAAAATAVFAIIGGALFLRPAGVTEVEYASARGQTKVVRLPDGSAMTLDADSTVTTRFGASERLVRLTRGRAYFVVTPDPSRPFSVVARGDRIVAVGTRFDVNLLADGLAVTLLEGRVTVGPTESTRESTTLQPGQQFIRRGAVATIRTPGTAVDRAITWQSGLISFDEQPLAEAVEVMNRYSQEQIVIRDPGIAALKLSGQFRAGDSRRFAETLAEIHQLRVQRQDNFIELIRH
jgi:transmembrane sensor